MAMGTVRAHKRRGRRGKTIRVRQHRRKLSEQLADAVGTGISRASRGASRALRCSVRNGSEWRRRRKLERENRRAAGVSPSKIEYARNAAMRGAAGSAVIFGGAAILTPLAAPVAAVAVAAISGHAAVRAYRSEPSIDRGWWSQAARDLRASARSSWAQARASWSERNKPAGRTVAGPSIAQPLHHSPYAPEIEVTKITLGQQPEPSANAASSPTHESPDGDQDRQQQLRQLRHQEREQHLRTLTALWMHPGPKHRSAKGAARAAKREAKAEAKAAQRARQEGWERWIMEHPDEVTEMDNAAQRKTAARS